MSQPAQADLVSVCAMVGVLDDGEAGGFVKDWGLMSVQLLLVVFGGYYIYQAMITLPSYRCDGIETSLSFMPSIMVGIILLGLAAMLQEIHKYRARKRSIISV